MSSGNLLRFGCAAALALLSQPAPARDIYDVVIAGGRVVDPETGRDAISNVGIIGKTIVAITRRTLRGKRTLDARGQVVAPGFIDLHAHGQDPVSQAFHLADGVTSAFELEIGADPLNAFYAAKAGKALINYGATASYLCARIAVLSDRRCAAGSAPTEQQLTLAPDAFTITATPEQEDQIVAMLDKSIQAGALGIGIGLEYAPAAGRREIYKVFKDAARNRVPVFVHERMRETSRAPNPAIGATNELVADAASTGASLHIVHVPSVSLDDTPTVLDIVRGAVAHGVDVTAEAYPYDAAMSSIGAQSFSDGWQQRGHIGFNDLVWAATGERLTAESFARYRQSDPAGGVIIYVIPQMAVDAAMRDPAVAVASDGITMDRAHVHPRGAGTFSRVLRVYVRERKLLDLRTALAKMTIVPARRLQAVAPAMARKGRVQVGADADLVVFDPATVRDNATYDNPLQASSGYRFVLVGGVVMSENGVINRTQFPGLGIRREAK